MEIEMKIKNRKRSENIVSVYAATTVNLTDNKNNSTEQS